MTAPRDLDDPLLRRALDRAGTRPIVADNNSGVTISCDRCPVVFRRTGADYLEGYVRGSLVELLARHYVREHVDQLAPFDRTRDYVE